MKKKIPEELVSKKRITPLNNVENKRLCKFLDAETQSCTNGKTRKIVNTTHATKIVA